MPQIYSYSGKVQVGSSRLRVRAEPNTSAPLAGSQILDPYVWFEVVGWTYGECVEGECRWWVSKYGNYVWVGGTIQKPPGSSTPPPPTPSAPAVPTKTWNDVAQEILNVIKSKKAEYEANPAGYRERLINSLISEYTKKYPQFTSDINNFVPTAVYTNLPDIKPPPPPPAEQQPAKKEEAKEFANQNLSQMTIEYTQSTVPYLTEEEAKRIAQGLGPLALPSKIFDFTIEKLGDFLTGTQKLFGQSFFLFLLAGIQSVERKALELIPPATTKAIVPINPESQAITVWHVDMADVLWSALVTVGGFLASVWFYYLIAHYAVLLPILTLINLILIVKNIRFWINPRARIEEIVNAARDAITTKMDVVASKIDVVAEKIDVIKKDFNPLLRLVPVVEKIATTIPEVQSDIRIQRQITTQKLDEISKQFPGLSTQLLTIATTLSSLPLALTQVQTSLSEVVKVQIQTESSNIQTTLRDVKTQLLDWLPDRTLGKLAEIVGDVEKIGRGFSALSQVAQGLMVFWMLTEAVNLWREETGAEGDEARKRFPSLIEFTLYLMFRTGQEFSRKIEEIVPLDESGFVEKMKKPLAVSLAGILVQIALGRFAGWLNAPLIAEFSPLIAQFASFRIITTRLIGAFGRVAFNRPFIWALNMAFRTEIPTVDQITWWNARGLLSPEQWELAKKLYGEKTLEEPGLKPEIVDNVLAMRGLPEGFAKLAKVARYRPLDPFSFAFLSQTGYFDLEEISFLTRDMGYRPEVRDYLTKAPMMWGLSPFKTSIRTRIFNGVSEGFIEEEKAVKFLEDVWKILNMRAIMNVEAKTRYWYERTKEKVEDAITSFVKGTIDENELRRELSTGPSVLVEAEEPGKVKVSINLEMRVVDKDALEDYVRKAKLKRYRAPREETLPEQKRFVLATLTDLYKEEKYDEKKFREVLERADKITDFVELALFRADLKREYDNFLEEKKKEKEELKNYLSLIANILVTEYREGVISKETLDSRLEEAKKITDLKLAYIKKAEYERELEEFQEKKRIEKEELKNYLSILANILITAYSEGRISKERFESEMALAEQIKSKKVAYILKGEWEKFLEDERRKERESREKAKEYVSLLASAIITAFREGYISYDELDIELQYAEQITDKKIAYGLKAQWERFNEHMAIKIANLENALDVGKIDEGTFYSELSNLGVQDWKIEDLLEKHEIKKYGKILTTDQKWLTSYRAIVSLLDKISDLGFLTKEQVKNEIQNLKLIVSPIDMIKKRRDWEIFFDERKIALEMLIEQFRLGQINEVQLYDDLKRIFVVKDKLEEAFNLIKAGKYKI